MRIGYEEAEYEYRMYGPGLNFRGEEKGILPLESSGSLKHEFIHALEGVTGDSLTVKYFPESLICMITTAHKPRKQEREREYQLNLALKLNGELKQFCEAHPEMFFELFRRIQDADQVWFRRLYQEELLDWILEAKAAVEKKRCKKKQPDRRMIAALIDTALRNSERSGLESGGLWGQTMRNGSMQSNLAWSEAENRVYVLAANEDGICSALRILPKELLYRVSFAAPPYGNDYENQTQVIFYENEPVEIKRKAMQQVVKDPEEDYFPEKVLELADKICKNKGSLKDKEFSFFRKYADGTLEHENEKMNGKRGTVKRTQVRKNRKSDKARKKKGVNQNRPHWHVLAVFVLSVAVYALSSIEAVQFGREIVISIRLSAGDAVRMISLILMSSSFTYMFTSRRQKKRDVSV